MMNCPSKLKSRLKRSRNKSWRTKKALKPKRKKKKSSFLSCRVIKISIRNLSKLVRSLILHSNSLRRRHKNLTKEYNNLRIRKEKLRVMVREVLQVVVPRRTRKRRRDKHNCRSTNPKRRRIR